MLGRRLRVLRESLGITAKVAGAHIGASSSTVSRIERGRVRITDSDLNALLNQYHLNDDEERLALLSLNSRLNEKKWWGEYGDYFSDWFCSYLILESVAQYIWTYEVRLVPGLLQTEAYAEAIIRSRYDDDEHVRSLIDVRMRRQRMAFKNGTPNLWAIVDHSALADGIDDADVMRAQIEFLIRATELKDVRIQILRPRSGLQALRNNSFSILRCRGKSLSDVVYLENLESAIFLDDPGDSEPYRFAMGALGCAADQPKETRRILEEALRRFDQP